MVRQVGGRGAGQPYELVKRETMVPDVPRFFVRIRLASLGERGS